MLSSFERVSHIVDVYKPDKLIDWYVRVGKKEARRVSTVATKIGSRVHELIEKKLRGEKVRFKKADGVEVLAAFEAFERFESEYELETISMEEEVVDEELGVIGHYDWYGKVNGKITFIDWKTSSAIKDSYWVQLHAYAYLAGVTGSELRVVRLDKNLGDYETESMSYDPYYMEVFRALLLVHRHFSVANGMLINKGEVKYDGKPAEGNSTNN